ncbi:unnamed protein product [Citrullus colocynthis]|uniref:Uncharacterized protein n=1 Tax=Citrullus colocynthis TaxID=252529 RepID=A0ABP0YVF4_9ROSI
MKARIVLRKVYDYIRYDLKEIVLARSSACIRLISSNLCLRGKVSGNRIDLHTPNYARIRMVILGVEGGFQVIYAAGWVRDVGPDLRPNDYKVEESENKTNSAKSAPKEKEPSTLEDLAVAARGGNGDIKTSFATGVYD